MEDLGGDETGGVEVGGSGVGDTRKDRSFRKTSSASGTWWSEGEDDWEEGAVTWGLEVEWRGLGEEVDKRCGMANGDVEERLFEDGAVEKQRRSDAVGVIEGVVSVGGKILEE